MKKQPIFCLFIAFSIGIVVGDIYLANSTTIVLILFFCSVTMVVSIFVEKLRYITILTFFISLGFSFHSYFVRKNESRDFNSKRNIIFQTIKKLNSSEKNTRYVIEITHIEEIKETNRPFYTIFALPKQNPKLDFTKRYFGEYFINKISPPQNLYQFDYQKYMLRNGVAYQIYSKEMPRSLDKEFSLADRIRQARLDVLQKIDDSKLSHKSKNFLKGIILADRTDMDSEISRDFTKSGLVHLLAISGTHMVIIFWLFMGIIKAILSFRLKNIAIFISIILTWCYSAFIDYGNSIVRACLMLSIYYVTVLLRRKPDLLHSIGVAGLIILAMDSQQLFNVGFQLSFLSVFGIYWLNKPILDFFPKTKNKFYEILKNVISVTVSVQIITLPLILYYFHQFSFISIISNIVVVPFAEIIITFSLCMAIILSLGMNFHILNLIYDETINSLLKLINFFADIDLLFFDSIELSIYEVILAFIVVYFLKLLLVDKNFKRIVNFGFSLLIFLSLRLGLDFYYFHEKQFLEHFYNKKHIFSIKENSHVLFFIPKNLDIENLKKYLIKPYILYSRSRSYEISEFDDSDIEGFRYKYEIKKLK